MSLYTNQVLNLVDILYVQHDFSQVYSVLGNNLARDDEMCSIQQTFESVKCNLRYMLTLQIQQHIQDI